MMKQLCQAALVVPDDTLAWFPQALGPGSVVDVVATPADFKSPLGLRGEILVDWVDIDGRKNAGWLARTTTFMTTTKKLTELRNDRSELTLHAYDMLREKFAHQRRKVKAPWTPLLWFSTFGEQYTETLLPAVIRELGGTLPRDATSHEIIVRTAARLITDRKEISMSEIKEAGESHGGGTAAPAKRGRKPAAKKTSAKKTTAKRAKRVSAEAPARSMARTVGNTLLPLLEKAGAKRDCISIAKHLANDESVTKKQLHELRDAVNELATEARGNNKESLASSLSGANRLVRRLARKA